MDWFRAHECTILKFRDILFKLGYKQCACEPCLFYRENELGVTMLVSYVDDNAIAGDEAAIEDTLKGVAIAL